LARASSRPIHLEQVWGGAGASIELLIPRRTALRR